MRIPFEELDHHYFDYLWYVTQPVSDDEKEKLTAEWNTKRDAAGWTQDEYDKEFDIRYPPKDTATFRQERQHAR